MLCQVLSVSGKVSNHIIGNSSSTVLLQLSFNQGHITKLCVKSELAYFRYLTVSVSENEFAFLDAKIVRSIDRPYSLGMQVTT